MRSSMHCSDKYIYPIGDASTIYTVHCIVNSISSYAMRSTIRIDAAKVKHNKVERL
jgi:hypothetical protein